jgi:hypothetical protein
MKKRIFINARYAEEKRVAIVEGNLQKNSLRETFTKELLQGLREAFRLLS